MLNDDNTEFLLLGTKQQLAKVDINSITVGESVVNTKPVVRNLGSWFDSQLSMSTHISKLCSSAFFYLHNISRIRKSLSPVETKSLVLGAPKLWNALPRELGDIANLHTFKSNLKTYLFEFAYG